MSDLLHLITVEAGERGMALNNLFLLDTGEWRANFRGIGIRKGDFGGFGAGPTPEAAVRKALDAVPPLPKLQPVVSTSAPRIATAFAAEIEAQVAVEDGDNDIFG